MVILIGGSSHVGKTLLSQQILNRYKIPYISLDYLKMAFIHTGMTDITEDEDDKMREFLWLFAVEIIKTAVERKNDLIIEGTYIPTDWKKSFTPDYTKEIRGVFMVMSEHYLRTRFHNVKNYANVIEKREKEDLDLDRLIACSRMFKQEALLNSIPVLEISENFDLVSLTESLIKLLMIKKN